MIALVLLVVALAALLVASRAWSHAHGAAAATGRAKAAAPHGDRISLVTEAVAYLGAVLILAGISTALGQRWTDLPDWAHAAVLGGVAVLFLAVGTALRGSAEPALRRLVSVTWALSVAAWAATVGVVAAEELGMAGSTTALTLGIAAGIYASVLWRLCPEALQHLAMLAAAVVTLVGFIASVSAGSPPSLATGLSLWAFGIAWGVAGWRKVLVPDWVAVPMGLLLALVGPAVAAPDHGWVLAIGIGTAAAVMTLSVRVRHTVMLGLGAVAMFGYLTATVVRYLGDSLGTPAALALTGVVVLVLATVSARLARLTRRTDDAVAPAVAPAAAAVPPAPATSASPATSAAPAGPSTPSAPAEPAGQDRVTRS